ncbi:PTS sugar transporter subunit IIA [Brachybacterium hainanense]|uniref:PTS sugar transporter subunit IIA n=1 Tax=Brachybacterium hainanense TaxID=1541174 RepID=A0ABV6R9R8_9MICO
MSDGLVTKDLVQVDLEVASTGELFAHMSHMLQEAGYVKESFGDALALREATYPTALPTQPEAMAIPHADAVHILEPFIAPIRLASPIPWHEMGNDDVTHPVRFVFLLGFTKADGHVKVLQDLMIASQDPEFFPRLASAGSAEEYFSAVQSIQG